jgi:uncharacterized protein (DUF1778 family)
MIRFTIRPDEGVYELIEAAARQCGMTTDDFAQAAVEQAAAAMLMPQKRKLPARCTRTPVTRSRKVKS